MNEGTIIESGALPDGTPYRIWRCRRTGGLWGYIGTGSGRRRSVRWIRKQLKECDRG